jgi:hypothetical protein
MSEINENVSTEQTGDITGASAEPMEAPEPAGVADWRDSIPSDIRSSIDVESLEDLAKGYVNAQQMIGGSIRIPGKEAGKDDWDKFYSKFNDVPGLARYNPEDLSSLYDAAGRPQSAKDYKVDGAPPEFLQAAHDAGLNRAQVEAIIDFEKNTEAAYSDLEQQEIDQGINTLKQEWGHSFDRKLEEGQRAVAFLENTVPGLTEALESTGAGNHPAMVKVFQALGANLQEGAGFSGSHAQSNAMTPYEAKMQIQEILNNEQHPYHEGDEAATERFLELHRYANVG